MTEPNTSTPPAAEGTAAENHELLTIDHDETDEAESDAKLPSSGFAELRAMEAAYTALEPLNRQGQTRVVRWLIETLDIQNLGRAVSAAEGSIGAAGSREASRSADGSLSPKDFIVAKRPASSVERVACLAYYLTHYRAVQHFKTPDIVALNTESASHKFANASRDVDNADRKNGYIVSAGSGAKQITARGEALVEALPDREAVKAALLEHPHRQRRPSGGARKATSQAKDET